MNCKFILALDPSGSFHEGKGTSGYCILETISNRITITGNLYAKDYLKIEQYWQAHVNLINEYKKRYEERLIIILEDYILYGHKTHNQINSRMETSKLISIIQYHCFIYNIPYYMQLATEVKNRWSDEILHHKGYLIKYKNKLVLPYSHRYIDAHCKDAIRHAVHYATFKIKKGDDVFDRM